PYRLAKKRENDAALEGLGQRLSDLAAMDASGQIQSVIRGIFAGNLYDLGATETAALYEDGASVDFSATLADLPDRPWRYDDLDALVGRLDRDPVRSAMVLVDNAGGDIGLGILPLAWHLLESADHVVLAANETPSLNDVTVMELADLVERAVGVDDRLAQAHESGRLEVVSTGNGAPLIDLSVVTAELKEAAERTAPDLLVIEGMGRALESNFRAQFTVDTLKIAMIKDQGVADAFDASLYDLVCRFEPAVT
ncbi:MAG: ARMT1-like domain-containing protein, partial [Phycisphaeraceae bacterium]|nr:ARMT1-like domain-containing protein [Phycisphaeraceae bacterium]